MRVLTQRVRHGQHFQHFGGGRGIALAGKQSKILIFLARCKGCSLKHISPLHLHCYRLPHLSFAGTDEGHKEAWCVLSPKSCCSFQRANLGMTLPEEVKHPAGLPPLGLAPITAVRPQQLNLLLLGRPTSGRPSHFKPRWQ